MDNSLVIELDIMVNNREDAPGQLASKGACRARQLGVLGARSMLRTR